MSVNINNKDGTLTKVGSVGIGKLVPSVSQYQSGTFTRAISDAEWAAGYAAGVDIPITTPFADAQNLVATLASNMQGLVCQLTTVSSESLMMDCYFNPSGGNALVQADGISVYWQAFKLMTDESRAIDEAAVEQNASDIAALKTTVAGKVDKNAGTPTIKDCNNIITCGMWGMNLNIDNQPTGSGGYGVLEVYGTNTDKASASDQWIFQRLSATNGHIYVRCSINPNSLTPTNWSAWKDITT